MDRRKRHRARRQSSPQSALPNEHVRGRNCDGRRLAWRVWREVCAVAGWRGDCQHHERLRLFRTQGRVGGCHQRLGELYDARHGVRRKRRYYERHRHVPGPRQEGRRHS